MLSSVAWLRRFAAATLACLALVPSANAKEKVLFTSSVSYCEPPELILVQQFDIIYYASNQSIFFNISAASVEDNVNVTANLVLNVYGMKPLNLSIDLCSILSGALCPLPTYNFTGTETLQLPSSLNVASDVPSIAYTIPDLEAFAQLTLTRVDTNEVKACVQATISNGWSTRRTAVEWATGALALLALLSAFLHSLFCSPEARAPFRLLDLFGLYQAIAASALLGLNYPVVYRAFASNFSWTLGLFGAHGDSSIQNAIDSMRHRTGGTMNDANGGSGVDLVNRKLSPYNVLSAASTEVVAAVLNLQSKLSEKWLAEGANQVAKREGTTVTVTSSNVLEAGIPVFVNSLGISEANAFMTVFLILLMLIAIALAILAVGWVLLLVMLRLREKKGREPGKLEEWREYYPWFSRAWGLRLTLIAYLPVAIFAFHQWKLKDSWLATLFSVITLLGVLAGIAYPIFITIRLVRRERPWMLYRDTPHLMSSGPLYIQYRHQRWFFFLVPLAAISVRAIIVAFASASGLAQVIVLLITELAVLGSILVLKPHETRGGDVLAATLAIARVLTTGLCLAFVESFGVSAIPRVVIGFVVLVVFSLAVILMFVNTLVNLGLRTFWREHVAVRFGTRIGSSLRSGSAKGSLSEKNGGSDDVLARADSTSEVELRGADAERPRNPTPHRNIPLDPTLNEPYPAITPSTSTSFSSYALPSPGDTLESGPSSGSTTLGSVLPRRAAYEDLGLDNPNADMDLEEGAAHSSYSPSSTNFSTASSAPSTPLSVGSSRRGRRRESWAPSAALPRMSEGVEGPQILETVDNGEQDEGRRSQRTRTRL